MVKRTSKEGFTLIELSFAMVFISLLSLAIVLIILNTISSYRRGITLSDVNSTGTQLVSEIRSAIQNSSTKSIEDLCSINYSKASDIQECKDGDSYYQKREQGTIKMAGKSNSENNMPVYGAFCAGTYSYIWNSGYYFADAEISKTKVSVTYRDSSGNVVTSSDFRLLKIKDENRQICMKGITNNSFDVSDGVYVDEDPIDLLASGSNSGANNLAIYDLRVAKPVEGASKSNIFYSGWFILGTTSGGPNINGSSKCAKPGDEGDVNFNFCAINRFSFAAQASEGK